MLLFFISSSKYYEKEALLMDPVDGPILASLLGNTSLLPYSVAYFPNLSCLFRDPNSVNFFGKDFKKLISSGWAEPLLSCLLLLHGVAVCAELPLLWDAELRQPEQWDNTDDLLMSVSSFVQWGPVHWSTPR